MPAIARASAKYPARARRRRKCARPAPHGDATPRTMQRKPQGKTAAAARSNSNSPALFSTGSLRESPRFDPDFCAGLAAEHARPAPHGDAPWTMQRKPQGSATASAARSNSLSLVSPRRRGPHASAGAASSHRAIRSGRSHGACSTRRRSRRAGDGPHLRSKPSSRASRKLGCEQLSMIAWARRFGA